MKTSIIILLSGSFSAILLATLGYVCRNWFLERLKGSIKYEYDEKIEAIKHDYNQKLEKLKVELQSESSAIKDKQKSELEHDKKIFAKQVAIVDETQFRRVVYQVLHSSCYTNDWMLKLERLEYFGEQIENQFLNPVLRQSFSEFLHSLSELTTTTSLCFFPVRGDAFALYPEWDKGHETYQKSLKDITEQCEALLEVYEKYRENVKSILFV